MNILPKNIASYGGSIDSLAFLITVIVGVAFLIACLVIAYALIRFRKKDGAKATYLDGASWKQLRWVIVPAIVLLGFDLFIDFKTHDAWSEIKEYLPKSGQMVKITAQQFSWVFTYPGPDGTFGGEGEVVSTGELHVPVGKDVIFLLESKDVVHSFWVPALRLKQDAVPGRLIRGWFRALEQGTYDIGCTQICGVGHTAMSAKLVVDSQEDFDRWISSGGKTENTLVPASASPADRGSALVQAKGCIACHSLDGSRLVGPSFKGLYGKTEKVVTNGQTREVVVDDAYLMKSMLEPAADVVDSYPNVMPPQRQMLSDDEIQLITEYLKTL